MENIIFIIAQIIGFVAFIISLGAYHKNKKEKILGSMIISNFLNLIHYIMLGAYSGCITKILGICRDSFVIIKDKKKFLSNKIFLYIFILVYILVGIYTYTNIWSIFPLIAAIIYIIPIWSGNEATLKKTDFICYFLWLGYNIFVFSISGIISNVISIISVLIAIINNRENKKKEIVNKN
jgi:hypothetical protein